jgi:hypothetical protein
MELCVPCQKRVFGKRQPARQRLGVETNAQIQRLLWDVEDSSKIMEQQLLRGDNYNRLTMLYSSDLFYYKTDAR